MNDEDGRVRVLGILVVCLTETVRDIDVQMALVSK